MDFESAKRLILILIFCCYGPIKKVYHQPKKTKKSKKKTLPK
jgi:hypothetical protein